MKLFRSILSVVAVVAVAFLAAPPEVRAQAIQTNDVAIPWPTVTAGVSSNITSWGNAGGYTAGASTKIQPSGLGLTFTYSFSCATVTLAAATIVLQSSPDNATWHNIPNSANGAVTITVPASAASANNTNVVFTTNVTQATFGHNQFFRVASVTNGNAASITGQRLTISRF